MKKLLLVDDSATFTRVLDRLLKDHFQVVGFGRDGAQGVELYREHRPDLVLLDITMPNVNGKECLTAIVREHPGACVIMISSLGDEQTVRDCLELGAKAFVNKDTIRMGNLSSNAALKEAIENSLGVAI